MGDHRLETGDNPDYIHSDEDGCRVCADARAKAEPSPHDTWVTPEEQAAREAASLSSYTDVPIPEIQDAIDALSEGENDGASSTPVEPESAPVPGVTPWDEVGLGIPDTSGGDVDAGNEHPTVEYGGPTIDAPEDLAYSDLAATNTGPTPQIPDYPPTHPEYPLFHEASEFSDDDTVVSGNDDYDDSDMSDDEADGTTNTYLPFGLSKTAVLTEEEVREQVATRIREVEVTRVQKELELWEATVVDAPTSKAQTEVNGLRILHANYIETFSHTFGGEQ